MKAMILERTAALSENPNPLRLVEMPDPEPGSCEVILQISACGVCHTEIDEIEGRTPPPRFPTILGHQVVGRVLAAGPDAKRFRIGDRLGVGWIYSSCGTCEFCKQNRENLCADFLATGRDAHGGYSEIMAVPEAFAVPIPEEISDTQAAPLLCAGAIGYRSLHLCRMEDGQTLGLTGFGASGHLVLKLARHLVPHSKIFIFARSERERKFAMELGAHWAGDTTATSPSKCHCIIDTTPVWTPVVEALRNLEKGGRLVINAIRKEDADKNALLHLSYPEHLWMEKEIKSVANVTLEDIRRILQLAAAIPILPTVEEYALEDANRAILELKAGHIQGAKVLRIRTGSDFRED